MSDTVEMFTELLDQLEEKAAIRPPSLPYKKRLVAFIDILGVSDKVHEDEDEAEIVVDLMNQIRNYVDTECYSLKDKKRLDSLQIGDGYLIVADFECINDLCKILSSVQWRILDSENMLLRGALTAGGVAIGTVAEYFIGPAILKAYSLERESAIFPRIIFHTKAIEEIEEYVVKRNKGKKVTIDYTYIVEDEDKIRYLDFVKYYMDSEGLTAETLAERLKKSEVSKKVKTEYEKHIRKKDNEKEAQKWGWLISEFARHGIKIA